MGLYANLFDLTTYDSVDEWYYWAADFLRAVSGDTNADYYKEIDLDGTSLTAKDYNKAAFLAALAENGVDVSSYIDGTNAAAAEQLKDFLKTREVNKTNMNANLGCSNTYGGEVAFKTDLSASDLTYDQVYTVTGTLKKTTSQQSGWGFGGGENHFLWLKTTSPDLKSGHDSDGSYYKIYKDGKLSKTYKGNGSETGWPISAIDGEFCFGYKYDGETNKEVSFTLEIEWYNGTDKTSGKMKIYVNVTLAGTDEA